MPRERSRGVWFEGENGSVAVAGLLLNVCGTVMLFFFGFPQRVTTKGAYLLRQRLLRHGGSGLSGGWRGVRGTGCCGCPNSHRRKSSKERIVLTDAQGRRTLVRSLPR